MTNSQYRLIQILFVIIPLTLVASPDRPDTACIDEPSEDMEPFLGATCVEILRKPCKVALTAKACQSLAEPTSHCRCRLGPEVC